ncbi:MAG: pyruvate kinase [bacterium]|nr:pyruvate kinase [bacterium]
MFKHTKIVATIGPSCSDEKTIEGMVNAGMNCARLNFSHGTHEEHRDLFNIIRAVEQKTGEPVTIMQDLQGPKIRVGVMPDDGVVLKDGQIVSLDTLATVYSKDNIPFDYPNLHQYLKIGERLLINDGRIETKVKNIEGGKIIIEVIEGGVISSHKGVNLPDSNLPIFPLTEKDKEDLRFGINLGVDLVAISFVNTAKDIIDIRYLVKQYEKELGKATNDPIRLIAKIERREAVKNIKEIMEVVDGVMVARGDLGVEVNASEVPLIQKHIIDEANASAKPVIVATQMLDSMQTSRRPTRAEVSDVANAVIDHTDAVMLSNETAVGKHPVLVVKTMAEIVIATERSSYDDTNLPVMHKSGQAIDMAVVELSRVLAEEVDAKIILAASITGETGRMISHIRPELQILVATNTERVQRQLNLSWGVNSFILPLCRTVEELVERSMQYIKKEKIAKVGQRMIVIAGEPVGQVGHVNLVEVREIK